MGWLGNLLDCWLAFDQSSGFGCWYFFIFLSCCGYPNFLLLVHLMSCLVHMYLIHVHPMCKRPTNGKSSNLTVLHSNLRERCVIDVTFNYSFIYLFTSMCTPDGSAQDDLLVWQLCSYLCFTCHKQKMYWDKSSTTQYCLNIVCLNSIIHPTTSTSNLLSFCIIHHETNQVQDQLQALHHSACSEQRFHAFTNCVIVKCVML